MSAHVFLTHSGLDKRTRVPELSALGTNNILKDSTAQGWPSRPNTWLREGSSRPGQEASILGSEQAWELPGRGRKEAQVDGAAGAEICICPAGQGPMGLEGTRPLWGQCGAVLPNQSTIQVTYMAFFSSYILKGPETDTINFNSLSYLTHFV